jgi:putative two-component system response regulator
VSDRVLIADNESANIELLKAFLGNAVESLGVTDSKLIEKAFKEYGPDLLLLDLHMPDPDGLEILRRLRSARASLGFVPVIVMTADETKVARNSALILGANDFLTKPLDREEVRLRVRNLLQIRHLFNEVRRATGSFPKLRR